MTDAVENQYIEMAYARVSSKNQTLARQEASILKEKVEELTEVNPDINLRLTVRYPEEED